LLQLADVDRRRVGVSPGPPTWRQTEGAVPDRALRGFDLGSQDGRIDPGQPRLALFPDQTAEAGQIGSLLGVVRRTDRLRAE
jgi:hypothetical protein